MEHYIREMASGRSAVELIEEFSNSQEFQDLKQRQTLQEVAALLHDRGVDDVIDAANDLIVKNRSAFPFEFHPVGEVGKSYEARVRSGFLSRYCGGSVVLDVGFAGYDNLDGRVAVPNAIGIDLGYPGYDGLTLPFDDGSVDTVFSSHCLEHILCDHAVIRDWFRTLKIGGFVVCIVPSQALYEKRKFLPSKFNHDHKRMYTPSSLLKSFELALPTNSYRVRHLAENDAGYDYRVGPEEHSVGAYEIELVIEKIDPPSWDLA